MRISLRALLSGFILALASPTSAEPGLAVMPAERDEAYRIDVAALAGDEIAFDLPGGVRVVGFVTDRLTHDNGMASWTGIIPEQDTGWFSVAVSNGVAHSFIDAGDAGVYEMKSRGDGTALYDAVRVDTMAFEPCAGAIPVEAGQRGIPGLRERALLADAMEQATRDTDASASRGGVTTIDVMIVYTAEARNGEGGTNGIQALAQNSINVSNIAYENSDITGVELRLVHAEEVDYAETDNAGTDLDRLRRRTDGFMDSIHATRDAVAADLVALLVDDLGSACGVAYLAPFSPNLGFSVTDADCAVGNLTFPHELGHNQGATHDISNAGGNVYSFGYGWRWVGTNNRQYRSVMAYSPGQRVRQFSNPDVSFAGVATGTPSANNAEVLRLTAASIAGFRTVQDPLTIGFPNGLPTELAQGETTTITVTIDPGTEGPIVPASAILFYGYDVAGQPFQFAPLVNVSGQIWETELPGGACGQTASFYVTVSNENNQTFNQPADPTQPFTVPVSPCEPVCAADTNGDGSLTPADFNAWILAFNASSDACDQNGDSACTAADFNAWILNYNAGC